MLLELYREVNEEEFHELVSESLQMITKSQVDNVLNANRRYLRDYLNRAVNARRDE